MIELDNNTIAVITKDKSIILMDKKRRQLLRIIKLE
jgi:hypothetical protein